MKIQNTELNETHIGGEVTYVPRHAKPDTVNICECGNIKSWNDRYIFVIYEGTAKATPPELLIWGWRNPFSNTN